jgi:hypothetical protein
MGLDAKIYWLTDHQSQSDFDIDFDVVGVWIGITLSLFPHYKMSCSAAQCDWFIEDVFQYFHTSQFTRAHSLGSLVC